MSNVFGTLGIAAVIGLVIILVLVIVVINMIKSFMGSAKRSANRMANQMATNLTKELINATGIDKEISKAVSNIKYSDLQDDSPKSVSGMTKILLPRIVNDFPDFDYDEMKQREEVVLISYLDALDTAEPDRLEDGSRDLRKALEKRIEMNEKGGVEEHYKAVHIHQTEIAQYNKTAGRCVITFQTALEYKAYTTNRNGAVVKGSKDTLKQTKFNVDLIYVQDAEKLEDEGDAIGLNCPNCGAPLKMLGSKRCEYCGCGVVDINIKAWNFSNVRDLCR